MKHMLHVMATIAMCFVVSPTFAYDFRVDGIFYKVLAENKVAVTNDQPEDGLSNAYNTYKGEIEVPAQVAYNGTTYDVVEVGDYAFYYCQNLTSLTLNDGITSIGVEALAYCSKLRSIDFPLSVMHVEGDALNGCSWYEDEYDGFIIVGSVLYRYKGNATKDWPYYIRDVKVIGFGAFMMQENLTEVYLPENLTTIEPYAFSYSGIQSINIPSEVTTIGTGAFEYCLSLSDVTGCYGVTEVGDDAFQQTPWLENMSNGPWYVGKTLMGYRGTMPDGYHLDINYGTSTIASRAFYQNQKIAEVTIPSTLKKIGADAFNNCWKLTKVNIPSIVDWLGVELCHEHFWYGSNPMSSGAHVYVGEKEIIDLVIPDGYERVPNGIFSGAAHLKTITLPATVKEVGEYAFHATGSDPKKVYCRATNPPILYKNSMRGLEWSLSSELYVPEESIDLYVNNTQGWETWIIKSINTPKPTIRLVDNELRFESEGTDVTYLYSFQLLGDTSGSGETKTGIVPITNRLKVTVQATSPSLDPSAKVEKEIMIDPYDVDGNGVTNITDVTRVVDKIVNGSQQ